MNRSNRGFSDKSLSFLEGDINKRFRSRYSDPRPVYNASLPHLTDPNVEATIAEQVNRYASIATTSNDDIPGHIWIAEKPDCAPIYFLGTCHFLSKHPAELFDDNLSRILSTISVLYSEIAFPTDDSLIDYCIGEVDVTDSGTKKKIYAMDTSIVLLAREMFSKNIKKLVALENDDIREKCGLRFTFDLCFIGGKTYWKMVNISEESVAGSSIVKKDNAEDKSVSGDPNTLEFKDEDEKMALQDYIDLSYVEVDEATAKRNAYWMKSLLETSKSQQQSLVLCGAGHFVGRFSLQNLIKHEGYTIKPLFKINDQTMISHPRSS